MNNHPENRTEKDSLCNVSYNPVTEARDLAIMDELYKVTRIQPVDMFPHTHHVENVVLLERREVLLLNN